MCQNQYAQGPRFPIFLPSRPTGIIQAARQQCSTLDSTLGLCTRATAGVRTIARRRKDWAQPWGGARRRSTSSLQTAPFAAADPISLGDSPAYGSQGGIDTSKACGLRLAEVKGHGLRQRLNNCVGQSRLGTGRSLRPTTGRSESFEGPASVPFHSAPGLPGARAYPAETASCADSPRGHRHP